MNMNFDIDHDGDGPYEKLLENGVNWKVSDQSGM
jgi:hypothetical protein